LEAKKYIDLFIFVEARVNSNKVDLEAQRFGANANTCVFTISGNYNALGHVNNVNTAVTPLCGYD
jgi:hypothetical protein